MRISQRILFVGGLLVAVSLLFGLTLPGLAAATTKDPKKMVTTTAYKKDGPWHIGVSAGYLTNSWIIFMLQHYKYEFSKYKEARITVVDANFNASKQVSDIEDLLNKKIDLLFVWAVDNKTLAPVLKKAAERGIPIVSVGEGSDLETITTQAVIDQYRLGLMVAEQLAKRLKGKGKIFAMLPIAGTDAAVQQARALKDVMKKYPKLELLSTEYGDWNRGKAKSITENLLVRYPKIDGVFSPAGQMSLGVAEAFEEAGRLGEVVMSPGDEYNGWLKWVKKHRQGGAVTFPTRCGQEAAKLSIKILKGEPVPEILYVPSEYISPAKIDSYVEMDKPDDWWASKLPENWKPAAQK